MNENYDSLAGFDLPQKPKDEWVKGLYEKRGLGVKPSLAQIEPIATMLLEDPSTAIEGAELILGRRVSGDITSEPDVLPLIATPNLSGSDRFGLLLFQKEIEAMQTTDASTTG